MFFLINPAKPTLLLPTPPECVTTTTSPFPLQSPVYAIIFLSLIHSADKVQSTPQILTALF